MARLHFRLKTLLATIAGMALAMGLLIQADRMRRLSGLYLLRAERHAQAVVRIRFRATMRKGQETVRYTSEEVSRIEYYSRLHERYEHASKHPWEAVPPDPPLPPSSTREWDGTPTN